MDSLTHTVLGACTGELIAGKKLGKKAMLIGAVVNNLPDIDMLANLWHSPAEALLTHRGITHSILLMLVLSPLLAWLGKKYISKDTMTYKHWLLLIAHGFVLHLGLDACTAYGTGWFEPFSAYRVSFNVLFILDPFLLFPLLFAAVTLLILKTNRQIRGRIATLALSISALYLLLSISFKEMAHSKFMQAAKQQNISTTAHFETPTALNNLLWYAVMHDGSDFKLAYYSLLDKDNNIQFKTVADNHQLLHPYSQTNDIKKLMQFSKDYYRIDSISATELQFSDVRFGQLMGCSGCDASFVFRYNITHQNGDTLVQQSEFQKAGKETFSALYRRILGHKD